MALNFVTHHLSHTTLSPTIFDTPSFTHHFVTHHLWHTILHTPLCHTPSFTTPSFTHNFVAHHLSPHHLSHNFVTHHLSPYHLSHTTLSHTTFHTQLCHTLSFTHNFHTNHLSHTTLSHTHTIFLCHTPSFTYNLVTHNFVFLLDPPPPPLSFLPSPSPLQHLVLIIGRSCLVGLSGPLISSLQCCYPQCRVQFGLRTSCSVDFVWSPGHIYLDFLETAFESIDAYFPTVTCIN